LGSRHRECRSLETLAARLHFRFRLLNGSQRTHPNLPPCANCGLEIPLIGPDPGVISPGPALSSSSCSQRWQFHSDLFKNATGSTARDRVGSNFHQKIAGYFVIKEMFWNCDGSICGFHGWKPR
jgi:hypothetical protein